MQRGMVGALYHDEDIAGEVLGGDKPGLLGFALLATDAEPAPLAERVTLEPRVAADHGAVETLDRSRPARQPLADEVPERALADEADAGRVALPGDRDAALSRDPADFRLVKPADGKLAERELGRVERMQEVALVLVAIEAAHEPAAVPDAGIMAGRKPFGPKAPGVIEADAELHFAVAEHVGIGRAPGLELRKKMREHAFTVHSRKACPVQRDAEFVGDTSRILEIRRGRAVTVLVLDPVRHEERFDFVAGVLEQGRRNRGVDTARKSDDDARHGLSPPPAALRARRAARGSACRADSAPRAGSRRRTRVREGCGARLRARQGPRGRATACG